METATPEEVSEALRISPLLYDAVLDESRWPDALREVAEFCRANRAATAQIFKMNPVSCYAAYSWGLTEEDWKRYLKLQELDVEDPRTKGGLQYINQPHHCRQLISDAEWHASKMYKEVFAPSNTEYTLGVGCVDEELNSIFSVGVYRDKTAGAFDIPEVNRLHLLLPHIRRVGEVYMRLMNYQIEILRRDQLIDDLSLAIVFVDKDSKILYANQAASTLIDQKSGLSAITNRIGHQKSDVSTELRSSINEVAVSNMVSGQTNVRHLTLPRTASMQPLHVTISSVSSARISEFQDATGSSFVALYIMDPLASYETDTERLQRQFGLTKTEAEVLQQISDGLTLNEISESSNRSIGTVRTHSKSLFSKMGASRQADLIRIVRNAVPPLR